MLGISPYAFRKIFQNTLGSLFKMHLPKNAKDKTLVYDDALAPIVDGSKPGGQQPARPWLSEAEEDGASGTDELWTYSLAKFEADQPLNY